MDTTQRQVMKAEAPEAEPEESLGPFAFGAALLIVGGVALILVSGGGVTPVFAGGTLVLMGVAIILATLWARNGRE